MNANQNRTVGYHSKRTSRGRTRRRGAAQLDTELSRKTLFKANFDKER